MDLKDARGIMLCSEILNLHLQSSPDRERKLTANLEQIWPEGALFQSDARVSLSASIWFTAGDREFRGKVIARKSLKGLGRFFQVQFDDSCRWSEQEYRPKHLFNPLVLLADKIFGAMPNPPVSPSEEFLPAAFTKKSTMGYFRTAHSHSF